MKDITIPEHIQTIIFDLDGTLYCNKGLAKQMVYRLWWCLPLLAAERRTRKRLENCRFASQEEFYEAYFAAMAKGHWWSAKIAHRWYEQVYMPTMIELIEIYCYPSFEVLNIVVLGLKRGLTMAVFSDYGCIKEKMETLGINEGCFRCCIDAPSLGGLKPEKSLIEDLLKILNAKPETTLFIGDRDDKDGEAARRVGAMYMRVQEFRRFEV